MDRPDPEAMQHTLAGWQEMVAALAQVSEAEARVLKVCREHGVSMPQ
jgi:hypothetical protein